MKHQFFLTGTRPFSAHVIKDGRVIFDLGVFPAFTKKEAKILAQADAIKRGYDISLVVMTPVDDDF